GQTHDRQRIQVVDRAIPVERLLMSGKALADANTIGQHLSQLVEGRASTPNEDRYILQASRGTELIEEVIHRHRVHVAKDAHAAWFNGFGKFQRLLPRPLILPGERS